MSGPIADIPGGRAACAWCGQLIALSVFSEHSAACERRVRSGAQPSLFGDARGLFDEQPAEVG